MDEAWDIAFSGGCTNITKQKKKIAGCCDGVMKGKGTERKSGFRRQI